MSLKQLILIIFLFLSTGSAWANFTSSGLDSSIHPEALKEKTLFGKYGDDDTARALIKYWFDTRHVFITLFSVGVAATTVETAVASNRNNNNSTAIDKPFAIDPLAVFAGLTAVASCIFLIPILTHSRKKLVRLLEDRKTGKPLPKKYKKLLRYRVSK